MAGSDNGMIRWKLIYIMSGGNHRDASTMIFDADGDDAYYGNYELRLAHSANRQRLV